MRTSFLVMVMVLAAACAVDDATTTGDMRLAGGRSRFPSRRIEYDERSGAAVLKDVGRDVCALATQLPPGDICALICDPDAMKAQLRAEGEASGTCYEFSCPLPDESRVIVGVCLPPE